MKKRRFLLIAIAGGALIAICIAAAVASGPLGRLVCERIISGLGSATGGSVAVQSSHFDWRHLTAELDGISISNAGEKNAAPFLRADRMRLQFGVVSVLKRQIDLASLVIVRPKFNFSRAPHQSLKPVHMSIHHFQIVNGVFQADLGRFNLTTGGEDLNASITLESARSRYDIAVSARHVRVGSAEGDGDLRAQFENGRLTIQHLSLSTEDGSLQAKGVVRNLARPDADVSVHARIRAAALNRIPEAKGIESGDLDLSANVRYDAVHSWTVTGNVSGRKIGTRFCHVPLKNIAFDSNFGWRPGEAQFSRLTIWTPAGRFAGTATLRNARNFDLDGRLTGARTQEVSLLLSGKPLGWSGTANGRIHVTGTLDNGDVDWKASSAVRILPLAGKMPVSGNVRFSYRSRAAAITFADSQLQLPHTQLAFSGSPRGVLQVALQSENLNDLQPLLAYAPALKAAMPDWIMHAGISFSGQIAGALIDPRLRGDFVLNRAVLRGQNWGPIRGQLMLSRSEAKFSQVVAGSGAWHATGMASAALENWTLCPDSALQLNARFAGIDLAKTVAGTRWQSRISAGTVSGSVQLSGLVASPSGVIQISGSHIIADGERLDLVRLAGRLGGSQLRIEHAYFVSGKASATVSGVYSHAAGTWTSGRLQVKIDTSGFPVTRVFSLRQSRFGLIAFLQAHGTAAARIVKGKIEPADAAGVVTLRDIRMKGTPVGSAKAVISTNGASVQVELSGKILKAPVSGTLHMDAAPEIPVKGELHWGRIRLAEMAALVRPASAGPLPVSGEMQGGVNFDGPLADLHQMRATGHLDRLQVIAKLPGAGPSGKPNSLAIRNVGAIVFGIANGTAKVRSFHLGGEDTGIAVLGSIPCSANKQMDLTVGGSADLRIFELFDSRVRATGQSLIAASIRGTVTDPLVEGTLELKHGSFFLANVPNGLTNVNGTVSFNRDRATIRKLTARSGGGELNLGGFVSFGGGGPLVYNLLASAQQVRIRPAGSISITTNGSLRLSGTSDNSLLSGTVSVSHIFLNPNSDWGGLLASVSAPVPAPSNAKDFISGLQFDVHVVSAPNLQLSSSLGRDLETQVDLRLRGTPNQPVLLGTVSANQGELKIFGATYTINHAGVHFTNPVEIEPVVDLDLQTQAHGITVNITVTGTLDKLNINYRSDPPLQPRDIIALLAVGETPGAAAHVVNAPTAAETAALESSANTVLGQAISPESSRLSKLFGITNIKIDPLAQGSTVTPESRLTIQQQISRNITVTYVTNLAQTSEQIFRLEWALGRQYSVVAERDDNGEFGIDIQYKKRF